MPLIVHGEAVLDRCRGYAVDIPEPRFCAANELVSKIIGSDDEDGIPLVHALLNAHRWKPNDTETHVLDGNTHSHLPSTITHYDIHVGMT